MKKKKYPLHQSPLYNLQSKRRLAELLGTSLRDLLKLSGAGLQNYNLFAVDQKAGRKPRNIEKPRPELKAIHKRTRVLLARIETPAYLHSAVVGQSYISAAGTHVGQGAVVCVDLKNFFRSVTTAAVRRFFRVELGCSDDVVWHLGQLLTIEGHLPTGGNASPLLSFFAYRAMFDELAALAEAHGLKMAVYVDDISFSGPAATPGFLFKVGRIAMRYGLRTHKERRYRASQPKLVTGSIVAPEGLRLPNVRHQRIFNARRALKSLRDPRQRWIQLEALVGRLYEAAQFDPRHRLWAAQYLPELIQLRAIFRPKKSRTRAKAA